MTLERARIDAQPPLIRGRRGEVMVEPEAVQAMLRLQQCGWGTRRIATELGVSRGAVKGRLAAGGWQAFAQPTRAKTLDGHEDWLRERFRRHRGNADVVRQELAAEKGLAVSLRTVERAVAAYRQEIEAEARACVRFETAPGKQMQIDFGERLVEIGGVKVKVFLFVATLGYSRRIHVRAYRHERQESWFDGLESAFAAFGGVTIDVLLDNARALVDRHDRETREVVFNAKLAAFARHWGFTPKACAPYRARTKGKTENGVGYVKKNAVAGRTFETWESFEAHLEQWTRDIADVRIHGTTAEPPLARFEREERQAMKCVAGIGPFHATRELVRTVQGDCAVEVDTNFYSVPWRLIGEAVRVLVDAETVRVQHAGREVAVHERRTGKRERAREAAHFDGVRGFGARVQPVAAEGALPVLPALTPSPLLRPLAEYEALAGGAF
jgi:transposase